MKHVNILLIDDDPISLQLLVAFLKRDHYHIFTAHDGEEALNLIQKKSPNFFSCIVSDYLMPKKDGIELLTALKQDVDRKIIPFILQTSSSSEEEIKRGLDAGAFYYLLKPITPETLQSVVQAALRDLENHLEIHNAIESLHRVMPLMKQARFVYQSIDHAKNLSSLMGLMTDDPKGIGIGFFEIMINAVEHGNLGITYAEKTDLIKNGTLHDEIQKRLSEPQYADKYVEVELTQEPGKLEVTVTDMGNGFDFQNYMEFSLERAMDNHGRGIMMANSLSFDALIYSNGGRTATCVTQRLASPPLKT